MDRDGVGQGYLEHLTDEDLRLLAASAGIDPDRAAELRGQPGTVLELIERPELFRRVYGDAGEPYRKYSGDAGEPYRKHSGDAGEPYRKYGGDAGEPYQKYAGPGPTGNAPAELARISPFLAFLAAVSQAGREIAATPYVAERSAPRQQVPVFDAAQLAEFVADPLRRLFLAELLTSFVRVASGRYWTRTTRGWRSRRYSELDPVRLAEFAEQAPAAHRPGVYRRLGDVSLFLAGVFPDYAQQHAFGPFDAARLLRAAGLSGGDQTELATAPPIQLLEELGQRWYRRASDLAPVTTVQLAVVSQVADRFRDARRVLNHIADRYFARLGNPWFGQPGQGG